LPIVFSFLQQATIVRYLRLQHFRIIDIAKATGISFTPSSSDFAAFLSPPRHFFNKAEFFFAA